MKTRSSSTARIAAASALALALIVAIVVIGSAIGGGGSDSGDGNGGGAPVQKTPKEDRRVPASYEVQSGDTLTAIAQKTGVPVGKIEALNPQVDPQILIAGEKIKLR
jgi:LysM repeat protein